MNMINMKLLDCTIRDGGYINSWKFTDGEVAECLVATALAGFSFFEIGFRNKFEIYNNHICGKWRYCNEPDVKRICNIAKSKLNQINRDTLTNNIKLPMIACMIDYKNADIKVIQPASQTEIKMIRVAFHKFELEEALKLCGRLKSLGYIVSANAMATINYSNDEIKKYVELCKHHSVDYMYIADTYGCMYPDDLQRIYKQLMNFASQSNYHCSIGVHLHNNQMNAFANLVMCEKLNVDIVDSTIFGMGRGAGNLASEQVVAYVNRYTPLTDSSCVKLAAICNTSHNSIVPYYTKMSKSQVPTQWGFSVYHLIGSYFMCHPNYINNMIDLEIYNPKLVVRVCHDLLKKGNNKYFNSVYLHELLESLKK